MRYEARHVDYLLVLLGLRHNTASRYISALHPRIETAAGGRPSALGSGSGGPGAGKLLGVPVGLFLLCSLVSPCEEEPHPTSLRVGFVLRTSKFYPNFRRPPLPAARLFLNASLGRRWFMG